MPNVRATLTEITVRAVKPPERGTLTLWDGAQKNFGLRVNRGGAKSYIVLLDSGRRHTIGRHGDITLAQARSAAQRLRAEKTLGRVFPKFVSLSDARAEYLAQITVRPSTRVYYERKLGRLKDGRLSDITPHHINRILDPMARTSRNQALASFRTFFKWCMRRHYIDKNPCELMTLSKATFRSRVLSEEELRGVWRACDELGHFGTIVKLLILTGQRRSEIGALKTSYCKLVGQGGDQATGPTITLPSSLCKNGREHIFPVGRTTVSILSPLLENSGAYIFPARGNPDHPFTGWSKSKTALDRLVDVSDWTLHDLRRTFATIHARIGTPIHVTEKLLNHVSGSHSGIVSVYQRHTWLPEMRQAVINYESRLQQLLGPMTDAPNMVPLSEASAMLFPTVGDNRREVRRVRGIIGQ